MKTNLTEIALQADYYVFYVYWIVFIYTYLNKFFAK